MAEQALLDAVTAGIENLGDAPEPKETAATQETDDARAEDSAAGDDAAGAEEAGTEGDTDGKGAEGEDGDSAGAEGSEGTAGKEGGEAAKAGAAGTAAKAEADAAKGALDPVKAKEKLDKAINDPVDQRLKESTRERIQLLANTVKERDAALQNANTLFDAIDDTGMSAEELATMLGYARARHHGTAEQKKQAYGFLKEELRAIALELGETDAVDFLADHEDLREAVANNQITEAHAKELAISRSRAKVQTATAAANDQQTQAQRDHQSGVNALQSTGAALVKRDGEAAFLAKKNVLVAMLKPIFAQIPPSTWAQTFLQHYEALPKAAPAVVPPVAPAKPAQQPLRPGTPAGGGGKKEPKSLKDAVFAALDGGEE